jgi:hypothetical protein
MDVRYINWFAKQVFVKKDLTPAAEPAIIDGSEGPMDDSSTVEHQKPDLSNFVDKKSND